MNLYFIDNNDQHSANYLLECSSDWVPAKGDKITIIHGETNFTGEVLKIHWEYGQREGDPELWANVYCLGSYF